MGHMKIYHDINMYFPENEKFLEFVISQFPRVQAVIKVEEIHGSYETTILINKSDRKFLDIGFIFCAERDTLPYIGVKQDACLCTIACEIARRTTLKIEYDNFGEEEPYLAFSPYLEKDYENIDEFDDADDVAYEPTVEHIALNKLKTIFQAEYSEKKAALKEKRKKAKSLRAKNSRILNDIEDMHNTRNFIIGTPAVDELYGDEYDDLGVRGDP